MTANVERIFCERLLTIYLRQISLLGQLPSRRYVFHRDSASLGFSNGTVLETQVLGVETAEGMWRWAWDDELVAPSAGASAQKARELGEALGLPEFTAGALDVRALACRGYTLSAVATELLGDERPFMRCEQPDGVAVFVIAPVRVAVDPRAMPRNDVRQAISDMFAAFAQRDAMLTLRSAIEAAGFVVSESETEVVGSRGDDAPMVFKRAWFQQ